MAGDNQRSEKYVFVTSVGTFRLDKDGDLEIEIVSDERSSCHGCYMYLPADELAQFKTWLAGLPR